MTFRRRYGSSGRENRHLMLRGMCGAVLLATLVLAGCDAGSTSSRATKTPTSGPTTTGKQVNVKASADWQDTGVSVRPGNRLTTGCSGSVTQGGASQSNGPEGTSRHASGSGYPLAGVFTGSVIGRIGQGSPFYVGAFFDHTLIPATGSGTLQLRVNTAGSDAAGGFTCHVRAQSFQQAPLASVLTGTAEMRVDDPSNQGFAGPFRQQVALKATTDGSRSLIELTAFPKLVVGPINTQAGKDTVTVEPVDVFGAFGPYGPSSAFSSGAIKGLAMTLRFTNSISIAGTCQAPFVFTTGATTSPGKHFQVNGSAVDAQGNVTLVGSSRFSCNALYNPTDGKDVLLTITGTLAPSPVG